MSISAQFIRKIDKLEPDLKEIFLSFLEEIQNTVTKVEFNELKQVIQDLVVKVEELTSVQKELVEAQKELACAQKNTEIAIQKLTKEQMDMKQHMAGLGFYLENQAYKYLPELLKKDLNIEMKEKLIRKHIKGKAWEFYKE